MSDLHVVAGLDVDPADPADAHGFWTPEVQHNEDEGLIRLRFVCICGCAGGWAVGPSSDFASVKAQAEALGPTCGG